MQNDEAKLKEYIMTIAKTAASTGSVWERGVTLLCCTIGHQLVRIGDMLQTEWQADCDERAKRSHR